MARGGGDSLFGGLLASGTTLSFRRILAGDRLDNTHSDGLPHITHGKTTKGRVVSVGLDAHGLGGDKVDNGRVTILNVLGGSLELSTSTTIDLGDDLVELAGNVSSVAIEHGSITGVDDTRVVEDDDLGVEGVGFLRGIVLGITSDHTATNILDRKVLNVETDVVSRQSLDEGNVMHLDGLDLSGETSRGEGNVHSGLKNTSLNTTYRHSSNTTNLVNILKGGTEGLVGRALGLSDGIKGLEEGDSLVP